MLAPQALIRGLVSWVLPTLNTDSSQTDVAARMDGYGGIFTQPRVRREHALVREGSFFVTNNAQTGIVPTYGTGLVATSPFITIYNGTQQRINLAYAALTAIVAGACTTTAGYTALAVTVDSGNRYTSGGTDLSPKIVAPSYGILTQQIAGIQIVCGAIVATTSNPKTVVGIRNIRPNVSSTVINVVGDMNLLNFGSVEGATGSITIANANIMPQALPGLVIGPNCTGLIYLWYPVMTAPSAATYAPEIGFWLD